MVRLRAGLVATACLLASGTSASTFNIIFELPVAPSDSQAAILADAEFFWEYYITGYQTGISVDALTIEVGAYDLDGLYGTLAETSIAAVSAQDSFTLPEAAFIDFDLADLDWLEVTDELFGVLVHEIAHAMGFGSLWIENGVYEAASGAYLGAAGLAAYRAEFDPSADFVPVELDFGPGTADAHWAETWAGGPNALMTGFNDPPLYISRTTIASFRDLGYTIAPIALPSGMWLSLGALAFLGAVAGQRRLEPQAAIRV